MTQLAPTNGAGKAQIAAGNKGLQLRTLDDYYRFAQYVQASGLAPRGMNKPEQILVALQYGAELNLSPMQALSTVMVINQRPSLFGDGMLAVVQASGQLEDIVETVEGDPTKPDTLKAVCKVKRTTRPTAVSQSFSWGDAKLAGLTGSDTYKKYPRRMLQHRARALALHDAFPDILHGILTVEEAQEIPAEGAKPVFVDGATQPSSDLDALAGVTPDADPFRDGPQEQAEMFDDAQWEPSAEDLAADEERVMREGTK